MVRSGAGSGTSLTAPGRTDLGQTLRALRREKGLSGVELAQKVGVTQRAISRYEAGERRPSPELLERIGDALNVPKRARVQLLDQLHDALTQRESTRSIAQRGLRRRQEEIARIEGRATHIRNFQGEVVPGLLQSPGYARKVFEQAGLGTRPEDVARALAVRLDRQSILHDPNRRFGFVLTEAVLLWPLGGVAEMLAQLDRLQTVAELPNVDLAILPLGVEPPRTPVNAFNILDDELVLVDTLTEQLVIRDPTDVALYAKTHETFRAAAVSGSGLRDLFASTAARLREP